MERKILLPIFSAPHDAQEAPKFFFAGNNEQQSTPSGDTIRIIIDSNFLLKHFVDFIVSIRQADTFVTVDLSRDCWRVVKRGTNKGKMVRV